LAQFDHEVVQVAQMALAEKGPPDFAIRFSVFPDIPQGAPTRKLSTVKTLQQTGAPYKAFDGWPLNRL
jgi:hypothetical protein